MITFRITKQSFTKNTFFAKKTTPIANTLNRFGYLKAFDNKGNAIVWWYDNFIKSELKFKVSELEKDYKSIYPYYNTKFVRGNIWKYSYITLLQNICPNKGFSQIKVDKMTYKINPIKGNIVMVSSAKAVLTHNLTELKGKIVKIVNNTYHVKVNNRVLLLNRCAFEIEPQDYFILLSIRCN